MFWKVTPDLSTFVDFTFYYFVWKTKSFNAYSSNEHFIFVLAIINLTESLYSRFNDVCSILK